jgi:enoyl-CoA hydratase/carnithine racemase
MGYYLPHFMGTGDALMMLLTGEVRKASEWPTGLVQQLFPSQDALKEGSIAFATSLAKNSSPTSMAVIKKQVFTLPHMSLLDSQAVNDQIQGLSTDITPGANPDHEEGFDAFLSKREPNFNAIDLDLPFARKADELLVLPTKL